MDKSEVRGIVKAAKRGMITPSEAVIELARLAGVDARCDMGECYHTAEIAS